jgi:hypothetical protein
MGLALLLISPQLLTAQRWLLGTLLPSSEVRFLVEAKKGVYLSWSYFRITVAARRNRNR